MKATELRIGNWVENESTNRQVEGVQLTGGYNEVMFWKIMAFEHDISPIPLTEEWLVKLGFESEGNMWYTTNNISYNTEDNRVVREQPGILGTIYNAITRVSYVHQLQNLYFVLTGKELC